MNEEKLTLHGLEVLKEKLDKKFSVKNHKHRVSSIEGLQEAVDATVRVKSINSVSPDENGNIDIESIEKDYINNMFQA